MSFASEFAVAARSGAARSTSIILPDRAKLSEAPYAIGVRAEDFKEHVLPFQCGSARVGWSTRREHANDAVAVLLRR